MLGLILASRIQVIGPGAISYAGANVLEGVATRRYDNGWGLYTSNLRRTLLAAEDCSLLGYNAWLIVEGHFIGGTIVDCEADVHAGEMKQRGLLVDTNRVDLVHKEAWLVVIR